jgi:putative FmdB family regulatory protein
MPIYEYACQSCGNRFDKLQKLSDPDPTDCPQCGRPEVKRAVTAAAFRLKGGGWYETDFKSDSDKKRNLVEGSSSAGSGDSKTESAPAKTEAAPAAPAPAPAAPAASS